MAASHPTAITAPYLARSMKKLVQTNCFMMFRNIIKRIRTHLTDTQMEEDARKASRANQNTAFRAAHSLIQFPDIDLLSTIHPRVLEGAYVRASRKKHGAQDSNEGPFWV